MMICKMLENEATDKGRNNGRQSQNLIADSLNSFPCTVLLCDQFL